MNWSDITIVLGVDAKHLEELRLVWPTWMRHKPELREMPCLVFYDVMQVKPEEMAFLHEHPALRLVSWELPHARTQREKMLTGFVHVPAREVQTPWYLKIDTDVIATGPGEWIRKEWFQPKEKDELPVFITSPWGYSKPRYVMDVLDDWADGVPILAGHPRLNLPYSTKTNKVRHGRIISWLFFGRADWTREMAALAGLDGRLPVPSQDSFLFYCAARLRRRYLKVRMSDHGWSHQRLRNIQRMIRNPGHPSPSMGGTRGVLYYNTGTKCAVRLLVSLYSLRQHYSGPVTILSEGDESHALCGRIADALGAELKEWDCGVPSGTNRAYLAKTRYHLGTPYETTIALDSDTLVVGEISELFGLAEQHGFCVARLGNWSTHGRIISKRIRGWGQHWPELIPSALKFGPAINCGVVAFRQDAALCADWLHFALPGRESFIPDEVCCQILLHRHPHHILDGQWNRSCKHDDPDKPDTRIIHYHGKKHCRPGLPYHGQKWMAVYEEVVAQNVAAIRSWTPSGDRMLARLHQAQRKQQSNTAQQ